MTKEWLILKVDCTEEIPSVSLDRYVKPGQAYHQIQIGNWIRFPEAAKKRPLTKELERLAGSEEAAESILAVCRDFQEDLKGFSAMRDAGLSEEPLSVLLELEDSGLPQWCTLKRLTELYETTAGRELEHDLYLVKKRIEALMEDGSEEDETEQELLICLTGVQQSPVGFLTESQVKTMFQISAGRDERWSSPEQCREIEDGQRYAHEFPCTVSWRRVGAQKPEWTVEAGSWRELAFWLEFDPRLSWELYLKMNKEEQELPVRALLEQKGLRELLDLSRSWSYPNMILRIDARRDGTLSLMFQLEGLFEGQTEAYWMELRPEEYLYQRIFTGEK